MPQPLADEFKAIPMSSNLGQSLERAHRFAREQSHRLVTLEHLLMALAEDPEAALILRSANVDLTRLGTDVSGYLGGLLEDMRIEGDAEPKPDVELLRVLQAAASAAQQSKRRQIDGAIVLAAIVGDGKSPAAGLLKALGMTFEEAIRALQRSNTQARLKPKVVTPGAMPARAPAVPTAPAAPADAEREPAATPPAAEPPAPPPAAATGPAAEDFLAAARARIQQRGQPAGRGASRPAAAQMPPPPPPPAGPEAPPPANRSDAVPASPARDADLAVEPVDAEETEALTHAIEAAMAAPPVRRAEPAAPRGPPPAAPPAPPPASVELPGPPRPAWTPPPDAPAEPGARLPQPPPARPSMPFPGRAPLPPGEGPPRPPLPPPRPVMAPPVPHPHQAPVQGRAPPVPWSEGDVRAPAPRPVLNGEAHAPYPSLGPAPPSAKPAKGPRPPATPRGAHGERGPLVENIPRRMRVAVPAGGEVRIARDRIAALMQALNGAGVPQRGAPVARALTVRLRAPNGGFTIEATAPETQWVESASSLIRDDDAIWSWTVVPQRRGRGRLLLMVSARSIGPDGAGAETAPPDRVIDVRVRGNFGRALARWTGLLLALSGGVLLGRFGEALVPALVVTFREISGF